MEDDAGGYRVRTQEDGVCGGILAPNYVGATLEPLDVQEQITVKSAQGATRLDNKTVFLMPCKEAA